MPRKPEDVAKQLITYADAITTFAVIQSVALGFALWNGGTIVQRTFERPWLVIIIIVVIAVFYTVYASLVLHFQCTEERLGTMDATAPEGQVRRQRFVTSVRALFEVLFHPYRSAENESSAENVVKRIGDFRILAVVLAGLGAIIDVWLTWHFHTP